MPQNIIISAPNFHIHDFDNLDPVARTGSVSLEILHKGGAQAILLGHSEVGDSLLEINYKIKTLLNRRSNFPDFIPYTTLLVGETWEEYEGKSEEEVANLMASKLEAMLTDVSSEILKNLVVGYEPKWGTRGSGKAGVEPASYSLVNKCNKAIKEFLISKYGEEANHINLIFGGMTTPERAEELLKLEYVNALILGSAGNTVEKFLAIAEAMQKGDAKTHKVIHANFKAFNRTDSDENFMEAFRSLDDSFTVIVSLPFTDIYKFSVLNQNN